MIYAVRIRCSAERSARSMSVSSSKRSDFENVLFDRVSKNVFDRLTEKLPEQASAPSIRNTEIDGSGTDYIQAVYRADKADAKSTVLDAFERGAVADAKWYRIEWHECDHDEPASERTGCSGWQTERENGNVPSDV